MNYRIYQNIVGWEYVTTTKENNLNKVVSSLDGDTHILIIKHYIKEDCDEPYYSGSAKDFKQKVKKKTRI